jgi:hypothetical protein
MNPLMPRQLMIGKSTSNFNIIELPLFPKHRRIKSLNVIFKFYLMPYYFLEQVKQWWESYYFHGALSYILANKLKALKLHLKKWNEEVFGNVGFKWKQLLNGLNELALAVARPLSVEEKSQRERIAIELKRNTLLEEISWRQKSRAF